MNAPSLEWTATWVAQRVRVTLVRGKEALFVDVVDPCGAESRRKMLDRLVERFPAVDRQPIEQRLLELAAAGPPRVEETAVAVRPNPAAWDREVRGDVLLDEIAAILTRHVVLPEAAPEAISLWIVSTFVFERFVYSPRLLISSPDKRCGKSLLMRFVAALSAKPLTCENISAAALYRSVEKFTPTLLLDEADTYLAGKNVNEDLRGVVNAGFARGGCVLRCVGDDSEPTPFRCYSPLALGMIGSPPGTVEDRSISIPMRRKLRTEQVAKLAPGRPMEEAFIDTVRRIVRWAVDHGEALSTASPAVPKELDDRAGDCWFPLLAIADRAGGEWPARARRAALVLAAVRNGADTTGQQLLEDLRSIFTEAGKERLSTDSLIAQLVAKKDRPWPHFRRGQPIDANQLGRLLRPFDVRPHQFRDHVGTAVRGYSTAALADAWGRYLADPSFSGSDPMHPLQPSNGAGYRASEPVTATSPVTGQPVTATSPVTGQSRLQPAPLLESHGCHGSKGPETAELDRLVHEMAEDLDALPESPFRGAALREHYAEAVRDRGIDAALADARARYREQVGGRVLPLSMEIAS